MNRLLRMLDPEMGPRLLVLLLFLPFDLLIGIILCVADLLYWPFSKLPKKTLKVWSPDLSRASIIVLNWEGKHLLQEFLPSVLEAVRQDGEKHEVIVVDNGSKDGSVEFLQSHFPSVKVVALNSNRRFTGGNNAGVQAAQNDVVIFLNNDMQVEPDFIKPLLGGFQNNDVFAVSCQVFFQDKTRRREETGNTKALWKWGFIELSHADVPAGFENAGDIPIFWGGGGSCAFDRNKYLAMGGLDTLYDPFYLEDVDLSYQAWKRGWKSLFAASSVVVHKHRGTNKQKFGDNFVDNTIRKNQYLFIWKNITDFKWILMHVACLLMIQARLLAQTNCQFEVKAFFRALRQFPEALVKRYSRQREYCLRDSEIFKVTTGPLS